MSVETLLEEIKALAPREQHRLFNLLDELRVEVAFTPDEVARILDQADADPRRATLEISTGC